MPPLRVVLDTDVLVSALVFQSGALSWLPQAWQATRLIPLVSPVTLLELATVLSYDKFAIAPSRRLELMALYEPWCQLVVIPNPPPQVPECRDPGDIPFLELALLAQADDLVTGDRDLLDLAPSFSVPIITPNELYARLAAVD